jgi:hypothetical protein
MNTQAISTNHDTEFGVIKKTTDYGRFMSMGGNRSTDLKHVKEIEQEMERDRSMFASHPMLVNENWYIIDGQHRYEAAKNLGFPLYYIMQKGLGLSHARQLNITQKRWTMLDFARSYADSGRNDYAELLRINHVYPKVPLSTVAAYLSGTPRGGGAGVKFRHGDYKIIDKEDGCAALDLLTEVVEVLGHPTTGAFASALWQVLHHEDFDERTFIRKLKENPDTLTIGTSIRACLRSIEEVYNRHNKIATRLY